MMGFMGFGLTGIIPVAILLAVSFFVLLALENVKKQGLKTFGYVVAVLLWISAALMLFMGIYGLTAGCSGMKGGMRQGKMMQESTGDPLRDEMHREMMQGR
ncbi:MAG: hypothetical protein WBB66_07200 [Candidatus Omnitrophota bacterium]